MALDPVIVLSAGLTLMFKRYCFTSHQDRSLVILPRKESCLVNTPFEFLCNSWALITFDTNKKITRKRKLFFMKIESANAFLM